MLLSFLKSMSVKSCQEDGRSPPSDSTETLTIVPANVSLCSISLRPDGQTYIDQPESTGSTELNKEEDNVIASGSSVDESEEEEGPVWAIQDPPPLNVASSRDSDGSDGEDPWADGDDWEVEDEDWELAHGGTQLLLFPAQAHTCQTSPSSIIGSDSIMLRSSRRTTGKTARPWPDPLFPHEMYILPKAQAGVRAHLQQRPRDLSTLLSLPVVLRPIPNHHWIGMRRTRVIVLPRSKYSTVAPA